MKYYYMYPILEKEEIYIKFQGSEERIFKYFFANSINGNFLKYVGLVGIAQDDVEEEDLENCDFLEAVIGIPIFSERFYEKFSQIISKDLEFHQIEIKCKNKTKSFYLAKINRYENWIDYDKSGSDMLLGEEVVGSPIYTKSIEKDFYVMRDRETESYWVASEKLKQMVEQCGMNIKFREVNEVERELVNLL